MPGLPRTERRQPPCAHQLGLLVAILITAASPARVAWAVTAPPTFIRTFTSPGMCSPRGVGVSPSGDVFVGSDCTAAMHMARFSAAGVPVGAWDFPLGFQGPANGVTVDASNNVFVTDYDGSRVYRLNTSGVLQSSWGSFGTGPGQFRGPVDVVTNSAGEVYVAEINGRRVQKFTNNGVYLATIGGAEMISPVGIDLDPSGRLYVTDNIRNGVLRYNADGSFDTEFGAGGTPSDVAIGPDGNMSVVYIGGSGGQVFSPTGLLLFGFGSPDGVAGGPFRIAITPAGTIYVTEQFLNANRVMMFQIDRPTAATRTTFAQLKLMYR